MLKCLPMEEKEKKEKVKCVLCGKELKIADNLPVCCNCLIKAKDNPALMMIALFRSVGIDATLKATKNGVVLRLFDSD
jgi:prepilin signal peptidase PulO-like enzyme (type II secretory pathway)